MNRQADRRPTVYVDATGVGLPVVDVLKATVTAATIVSVFFTHGDRRTEKNGEIQLGKAFLVSRLQALLPTGRLQLPRTAEAQTLAQELDEYEIRFSADANDKVGAFKVGSLDDLVTALGLAVQVDTIGSGAFGWRARSPVRARRQRLDRRSGAGDPLRGSWGADPWRVSGRVLAVMARVR